MKYINEVKAKFKGLDQLGNDEEKTEKRYFFELK